jgi:hypothetical protein
MAPLVLCEPATLTSGYISTKLEISHTKKRFYHEKTTIYPSGEDEKNAALSY